MKKFNSHYCRHRNRSKTYFIRSDSELPTDCTWSWILSRLTTFNVSKLMTYPKRRWFKLKLYNIRKKCNTQKFQGQMCFYYKIHCILISGYGIVKFEKINWRFFGLCSVYLRFPYPTIFLLILFLLYFKCYKGI